MTYEQLKAYFGGLSKAAQALDVDRQVVHNWRSRGRIPSRWQIKLAARSKGQLKLDRKAQRDAADLVAYINGGDS